LIKVKTLGPKEQIFRTKLEVPIGVILSMLLMSLIHNTMHPFRSIPGSAASSSALDLFINAVAVQNTVRRSLPDMREQFGDRVSEDKNDLN
jgi:hypothetical protein